MNWNTFSHIFAFSSLLFSWLLFFPLKTQMRVTWIYNFQSMWETSAQLSKVQMFSQYFTDENRLFYVRDSYLELQIQSIKVDGLHFIFCQPLEWSCALVVADRFFSSLYICLVCKRRDEKECLRESNTIVDCRLTNDKLFTVEKEERCVCVCANLRLLYGKSSRNDLLGNFHE